MFWSRPAEPDDYGAVCELLTACGLPHDDLTPEHLAHFVLADHDGWVKGVVGFEPFGEHALARSLAVASAYRGQGLAGRLLDALEVAAMAAGVKRFCGLTVTAESYLARCRFEHVARDAVPVEIRATAEFTSLCPAEAVCLQKDLIE